VSPHREFREAADEMMVQWIKAHCNEDADPTEVWRTLVDLVGVRIGSQVLRGLPATRAYHVQSGELGEQEALHAGNVIRLIRRATGMADEPGQPVERPTRNGLRGRLRK
jgi:hypothetical protein